MGSGSVFIGVVSYPGSRFAVNQGPDGLAAQLANSLSASGIDCSYVVNTSNTFDTSGVTATRSVFLAGITEEVRLEDRWMRFLGIKRGVRTRLGRIARWGRVLSYHARTADVGEIKRLINIERSHLDLMRQGLDSGSDWVLILEDDAFSKDISDLASGLEAIVVSGVGERESPAFVNLSESFPLDALGVRHLLTVSTKFGWQGRAARDVLEAAKPATNTVCAILYSRLFLENLVAEIESIPAEPVVPIDWRLNQALMNLWDKGLLSARDCWFVDPAPIDQLSMRA